MLDLFRQDSARAVRSLARSPLFTFIAVASVAVGIGATTAIVTLANTLLFRSAPGIGEPDRVVSIGRTQNGQGFDNFSYPTIVAFRQGSHALTSVAAVQIEPTSLSLAGPDGGEHVRATIVSGNFFEVLQVRPHRGRFFLPEEDSKPRTHPVVVLSHRFWRQRLNSDEAIVGRAILLNGTPFTVVGVAAEKFQGPFVLTPDLWLPVMAASFVGRPEFLLNAHGAHWLIALGRLRDDAPLSQAQTELSTIARQLQAEHPRAYEGKGVSVAPLSFFPGSVRTLVGGFMVMLLAVAGLVLLIASTNVAGMLLARATGRQREIAVRLAIGATRAQVIRQLVTESMLLFLISGVAGVLLAQWLVAALMAMIPRIPAPLFFEPILDWRVLTFALVVSLATGLVAGLMPALQTTTPALVPALKTEGGGSIRRMRLRHTLLVSQIAFSMLLLIVAGLFARALVRARDIDPGFDPRNLHLATLDLELANYDSARGLPFAATLLERAKSIPGVTHASLAAMLALDGGGLGLGGIQVPSATPDDPKRGWDADWNIITPEYFETMRMPLARGRPFTDSDISGAPRVAIINETFAKRLWPNESAVGKTFINTVENGRVVTIVGVARDSKYRSLGEDPRNFVYVPLAQNYFTRMTLLVRTDGKTDVAVPVRRLVGELEPALPILNQKSFEEHASTSLFPQRMALWVAGSLGSIALLLALLGIYGVNAYSVAQRTREIGVRVALGAQRADVMRLVLKQGLRLAGIGVVIGAVLGLGATRLLRTLLYGVPASDLIAFGTAGLLLLFAALAASWVPATRAASVDPVIALRAD